MITVFQYGSNMALARFNGEDRLAGDARKLCIARTAEPFELVFSVWSKTNNCAAADIVPSENGRSIYGVLYEIPEFLLLRDSARAQKRKSLDAIEGEGANYVRSQIDLITSGGEAVRAVTYIVKDRRLGLKTSAAYATHIINGLVEHDMPAEYCRYVLSRIIENNGDLRDAWPDIASRVPFEE